jgi:protein-S-isoprenylcysteine O-methyltransferase Ste14
MAVGIMVSFFLFTGSSAARRAHRRSRLWPASKAPASQVVALVLLVLEVVKVRLLGASQAGSL